MTSDDLHNLLDYHYWARDRVLDAAAQLTSEQFVRDMGSSFRSVRDTLAHIYGADLVWYLRWTGTSPTSLVAADRFGDVAALAGDWADLEKKVRPYVAGLDEADIARVFEYRALNGTPGASPFWQMLQHVVNHASYHRGQVTTMIRQLGGQPARSLDLIAFYRERAQLK
ncbi:MAG TPA: DinB family protein [Vicinamibacterales bacterium]|jgi:uncharacterized damage-inducible protein DinB|nr:DinB family protein [Vicinamibacterales bacterium]